jgi:hypothetical protein
MSASQVLAAAHAAGLRVSVDGGDLELEALHPPPEPLLRELKRLKSEVLELLSSQTPYRGSKRRVVEWLDSHPEPSDPGKCAWCGRSETTSSTVVPFGTRAHAWLHPSPRSCPQ